MPLFTILIALLLGGAALAFVFYPLYYPQNRGGTQVDRHRQDNGVGAQFIAPTGDATEREQAARAAIYEVELDYQLGNIAESDYRALRERYMRRALAALKARYEADTSEQEIDAAIEEQVRQMRERDAP